MELAHDHDDDDEEEEKGEEAVGWLGGRRLCAAAVYDLIRRSRT